VARHLELDAVVGDDFKVLRKLGEGGMGVVFEAVQLTTGHRRALKVMHAPFAMDLRARERFEQEARIGARVPSDHVVQIVAAGIDERSSMPYLAMELLEGQDLERYIRDHGAMSLADTALIMNQVTHALAAAHDVEVVHRDVKPENVFLSVSRMVGVPFMVKVLDFGIAKLRSSARSATVAVGTPGYMAPEQTQSSEDIGPAADIWSLGLVVFRMLTGSWFWRSAADGGALSLLWREMLVDPIPRASERASELGCADALPPGFDDWFAQCVDREPTARFRHARAAGKALASVFAAAGVGGSPLSGADAAARLASAALSAATSATSASGAAARSGPKPSDQPTAMDTVGAPALSLHTLPSVAVATHRVCFREEGERVVAFANHGERLLDVSLNADIPHFHACGGKARCSTCRVVVLEGRDSLSPRTELEQTVAERRSWPASTRLACQARVHGPCMVRRLVIDSSEASLVDIRRTGEVAETRSQAATVLLIRLEGIDSVLADGFPDDAIHVLERCMTPVEELLGDNGGRLVGYEGSSLVAAFDAGSDGVRRALRVALRAVARIRRLNPQLLRHFGAQVETAAGLGAGTLVEGVAISNSVQGQVLLGAAVRQARQACNLARSGEVLARGELLGELELVTAAGPGAHRIIHDFAKSDVVFLVQSSFDRLDGKTSAFAEAFYNELFELHPAAVAAFEHTDMVRQRKMLMDTLALAIRGLDDFAKIEATVRELGERHVDYGATLRDYKFVGQALLNTLERFLGDAFTAEADLAWREVYSTLVRTMTGD
jgi:ferredoxin/hemoglobin-like flavoprotein/tRNA A-37 threonylcarbamoyl transferase component Bud32